MVFIIIATVFKYVVLHVEGDWSQFKKKKRNMYTDDDLAFSEHEI